MEQLIIVGLMLLYGIGVGIFRFFKWVGRQINTVNTAPSPIQQAMAEAQRQAETPRPPTLSPVQPRPPTVAPPWEMPRQPQAGPPAVPDEATDPQFRRQERELLTEEPAALGTSLRSEAAPPAPRALRLFETDDDLVRAFILREALGPPLCRRGR